jgi:thiol-disulfide isomerase/thioredoxin
VLILVLVALTVAILGGILVAALSRSASVQTATPTAVPTTASGAGATGAGTGSGSSATSGTSSVPNYGGVPPVPNIGVLDNNAGQAQKGPAPKVGQPAPDFDWLTTSGPMRLSSLRGHPVLIEFFATWCPQCQQDVRLLNSFATSPQYKGLQVLAITASPYDRNHETMGSEAPGTIRDIDWYRRTFGAAYNFIFDPGSRVFNLYGYGQSYPTFFLIDANGIIRFTTSTYILDQDLTRQVEQVV